MKKLNSPRKIVMQAAAMTSALIIILIFNIPLINAMVTSFKSYADIYKSPPVWVFKPTLQHYIAIFTDPTIFFPHYLLNSVIICLGSAFIVILICLPAAYSIVHYGFGRRSIFPSLVDFRAVPLVVFAIPVYVMYQSMGLIDTLTGLILFDALFNIPLAILLFVGFIQDLPEELEDAARVDGCSTLGVLRFVVFPLMGPIIAAVGILTFIYAWGVFLFGMILTVNKAIPVTVGITYFITAWGVKWGEIAAAAVVSALPPLLFSFYVRRYLIRGITAGAVKG